MDDLWKKLAEFFVSGLGKNAFYRSLVDPTRRDAKDVDLAKLKPHKLPQAGPYRQARRSASLRRKHSGCY